MNAKEKDRIDTLTEALEAFTNEARALVELVTRPKAQTNQTPPAADATPGGRVPADAGATGGESRAAPADAAAESDPSPEAQAYRSAKDGPTEPEEPAGVDLNTLRKLFAAKSREGKVSELHALLGRFGVAKLPELTEEQRGEVYAQVEAL